jgi:hypothetical protein
VVGLGLADIGQFLARDLARLSAVPAIGPLGFRMNAENDELLAVG